MAALATELAFALDVARLGGRVAMGHFGRDPEAHRKPDGSWVTQGDWETEAQIRLRISRTFPDHNVLGEEEGLTRAGGGPALEDAPTWVIDPIDGTGNYVAGIPVWATLVGLMIDGRCALGVAHAPALDETYDAAEGLGARLNGSPIRVAQASLAGATIASTGYESFVERGLERFYTEVVTRADRSRGFGDFWGHVLVARGAVHVMLEPILNVWDYAALVPIIGEAGGRMSAFDGGPLGPGSSCVTTNGTLHKEIVALHRELAP